MISPPFLRLPSLSHPSVRPYVIKQNRQLKCACGIQNKVNEPAHKHCGQRNKGSNKYLLRVDKTVQGIFNCIDDNKL